MIIIPLSILLRYERNLRIIRCAAAAPAHANRSDRYTPGAMRRRIQCADFVGTDLITFTEYLMEIRRRVLHTVSAVIRVHRTLTRVR